MNEIPKIIHYCWFGHNPLPDLAIKCINSWKKYFPGYEIKEWNEENFDVQISDYTKEAYSCKKYAFVSDYARFWVLYRYGGIYFDTDVEVLQSFDSILKEGAYMGCERDGCDKNAMGINLGLGMAVAPGLGIIKDLIEYYDSIHFIKDNGEIDTETIVTKTTKILKKYGLQEVNGIQKVAGLTIYPAIYFCPDDKARRTGNYSKNTYSAHHYNASWRNQKYNQRLNSPFWKVVYSLGAKAGTQARKILGDEKWVKIRDGKLKKIYNSIRGI